MKRRAVPQGELGPGLTEVLFELRRIGASMKVTAIDPETNTEVSFVGPASASRQALQRLAVRKLLYVLGRRRTNILA